MFKARKLSLFLLLLSFWAFYAMPTHAITAMRKDSTQIQPLKHLANAFLSKPFSKIGLNPLNDKEMPSGKGALFLASFLFLLSLSAVIGSIVYFIVGISAKNAKILLVTAIVLAFIAAPILSIGKQRMQANNENRIKAHNAKMNAYIGKNEAEIIKNYGNFGKKASDGNEGTIIRFEQSSGGDEYYDVLCKCYRRTDMLVYFTDFYLNKDGIIYKWKEGRK